MPKSQNKIGKKTYPQVTFIVPTARGGQRPLECLRSIQKLNYPKKQIRIILIDNNTKDKIYKKVKKEFKGVTTIRNKSNDGFAKAVNQAIKKLPTDYFFVTNDDIIFEKESIKTLIDYVLDKPEVGICGGKQISPRTKRFLAGGRNFNFFLGWQKDLKMAKLPTVCDQVEGCTMLIAKKVVAKIGLFDEGFYPAYGEDLDYCLRTKKAGFDVVYNPKAIFYHHFAHTTSKLPLREVYYLGFKNRLRLLIKHANLFQILSFFLFHYLLVFPIRLVVRREPIMIPEARALIWNVKNLRETLAARTIGSD